MTQRLGCLLCFASFHRYLWSGQGELEFPEGLRDQDLREKTLKKPSMKQLYLFTALVFVLFATALASSFQEGPPLKGEVLKAELVEQKKRNWKLMVKLLEEPKVVPSGYYRASDYKKGSLVETEVARSQWVFKKGDKVTLRWRSYSAMGANGPVGGLSWDFISKP